MQKIEEVRTSTASRLHNTAATLHDRADHIPGVQQACGFMHRAADKLNTVADYMGEKDTKQMLADAEGAAKRNPGRSLLIAGALGFLLGRALRRT